MDLEMDDSGAISDLDEADQQPVESWVPGNPLCYICYSRCNEYYKNDWINAGVYSAEEITAPADRHRKRRLWNEGVWLRYYRMILIHSKKRICRLSGISAFNPLDFGFVSRQAPFDEDTVVIRSETEPARYGDLLVTALRHETRHLFSRSEGGGEERLTCLIVHARCWQLLRRHRIWDLAGRDVKVITQALQRRSAREWKQPLYALDEAIDRWDLLLGQYDPFVCWPAEKVIQSAEIKTKSPRRRRKNTPIQANHRYHSTYLGRLPLEILLLVADLLPPADIAAMQQTIGLHFGDALWRSKIPAIFQNVEVRTLSEAGGNYNWEYLCLELEKLNSGFEEGLDARQKVFGRLDKLLCFLPKYT